MRPAARQRRASRISGILADAAALGVDRDHLRMVLTGRRQSLRLSQAYAALKQSQSQTTEFQPSSIP
jgi:hypothetical protein